MPNNAKKFTLQLEALAQALDAKQERVLKKVVFDLHSGVVLKTPVDTGRARASWQVSQGRQDFTVMEEEVGRTSIKGSAKGAATGVAKANAAAAIKSIDADGGLIYITNALPYMRRLENGHSKQAPNGMVALTLAEVSAQIGKKLNSL